MRCKCKDIKLCATLCPYGFIWETPKGDTPHMKQELSHYCIGCGHCESICPTGAVTVTSLEKPAVRFDKKSAVSSTKALQLLKTRRSVRIFKDTPIPENDLKDLMDVARWAPTASNKQQAKWIIYNSRERIQTFAGHIIEFIKGSGTGDEIIASWKKGEDIVLRHAPHLIVALGEKDYFWSQAEAGIALTYLELLAHAQGFGTCWAGFFTRAANNYLPLIEALDLPENHSVCGGIMLGYPVYKPHAIPFRKRPDIIWRD